MPIATAHDADGSLAFRIEIARQFRLAWATDLGHVDAALVQAFTACDVVGIEVNHDVEMLRSGPYPWFLKQRVGSDFGHLSNDQAADFLGKILHQNVRKVVGLHLSENNNEPAMAAASLQSVADKAGLCFDLQIASQDKILPLLDWSLSTQRNAVKKRNNNGRHERPIL